MTTTTTPPAQARDGLVSALEAALEAARALSLDAYDNPPMRNRLDTAVQTAEAARCLLAGVLVSRLDPGSKAMQHLTDAARGHVRQAAVELTPASPHTAATRGQVQITVDHRRTDR